MRILRPLNGWNRSALIEEAPARRVVVQDGDLGNADSERGGGIYNQNNGALTLTDVTVKNNSVTANSDGSGNAIAQGGGVFSGDDFPGGSRE